MIQRILYAHRTSRQSRGQSLVILLLTVLFALPAAAQTDTTLTYQGRLGDGGAAADGPYDMSFELYDAAEGGKQIGLTASIADVPVVNGLFNVAIDFGPTAFDNGPRWLRVIVEGTALTPLQPITRTPYAMQTRGITVDENGNVSMGAPKLPVGLSIYGSFTSQGLGGGAFSTRNPNNDNASFSLGWLNDVARLRIGGAGPGASGGLDIQRTGNASLLRILHDGSVGIGTTTPEHPLHIVGSDAHRTLWVRNMGAGGPGIEAAIYGTAESALGTGVFGECNGHSGNGVWGNTYEGTGVFGQAFADGAGVRASAGTAGGGIAYGVRSKCNSPLGYDFYAEGAGQDYGSASSRRWKSSIANIEDPLDKLARLRGVTFDWDQDHGGGHDIGFIAEEVGMVLPEIVIYEDNGKDAMGLDYSKMTPLLVEAVNTLRRQNNERIVRLERDLQSKDVQIGELRDEIAQLRQLVEQLALTIEPAAR